MSVVIPELNILQQANQNLNQLTSLINSFFDNGAAIVKSVDNNLAKIDETVKNAVTPAPKIMGVEQSTVLYAGLGLALIALIIWSQKK